MLDTGCVENKIQDHLKGHATSSGFRFLVESSQVSM